MIRFFLAESPYPINMEIKYMDSGKSFIYEFSYARSFVENLEGISPAHMNAFAFNAFLSKIAPGTVSASLATSMGAYQRKNNNGSPDDRGKSAPPHTPPDEDIPF
jgi:hypothetical protein